MVATGLDMLLREIERFRNRRVGLIVNQSSVTPDLQYSWNLLKEKGIRIERIFSPEHGLFATEQDQIAVDYQPELGCEVVSLYGDSSETLLPDRSLLDDLDLILFDIQDVGSRYYTYVNTLALFMEVLSGKESEIMVLDRPNPLGGAIVEGPMLDMECKSFVGIFPVPVRHAMTAGELALLYRDFKKLDLNLTVMKMEGWQRSMLFQETGLPWIPPSPNMPTFATAEVYPGMCLFEGLNISEGRGTTTPFQLSGAPFINPEELARQCRSYGLEGVLFRPTWYKPTFHKFSGEVCGGIWLQVTDHTRFRSFSTAVAMTAALQKLYGEQLRFLSGVYEFNDTIPAFDLLAGNSTIRTSIQSGVEPVSLIASWQDDEKSFLQVKQQFHLYD
ncbi:exo-beta-N-acetylmuramidase NamZ family protein [Chlorobium ferrooxidans]|uniref:Uncharacterized conserved protein UCP016719 n=1 Tax=Chlorobium ferrooxidans DSM 13031 TaxID=377431 RepID=Q0YTL2_9CHLB|nr:DUF1343 domain-containing protein [Chlorobium ferrooxidans]EAT59542.1 Uncharacterised conserved protein UCP016719 [Chlorobium ferrooxidans DSM 13031]